MENHKEMEIKFPNAMPNTKLLADALDNTNESWKLKSRKNY